MAFFSFFSLSLLSSKLKLITNKTLVKHFGGSDESIARVSSTGVVTGVASGSAVITATTLDGGKTVTCQVTVKEIIPSVPVPEAVDMGLSVMWASFNLGASKPEEYGNYYAWGETQTKSEYSEYTYKWLTLTEGVFKVTKYCPSYNRSSWGGAGDNPDNKTVLDKEDDAAYVNLGGNWRMPTRAEMNALIENCAWTWTSLNGVNGMLVTASNGNSIFLPAAGSLFGTDLDNVGDQGHYMNTSLESVDMGGMCGSLILMPNWPEPLVGPDSPFVLSFIN